MAGDGTLLDEHDRAVIQGRRILLVDDEPDICASLQRLLQASYDGLHVDTAPSGEVALDMIARAKKPYDIIMSDHRMPGLTGIEFLAQCRLVTPASYRVMLTAYPERELAWEASETAAVETFLAKPVDPGSILLNIKDLLQQRWLDDASPGQG